MKKIAKTNTIIKSTWLFFGEYTHYYNPQDYNEHKDTDLLYTAEDDSWLSEDDDDFGFNDRHKDCGYFVLRGLQGVSHVYSASKDPVVALLAALHQQQVDNYNYQEIDSLESVGVLDTEERATKLKTMYAKYLPEINKIVASIKQ